MAKEKATTHVEATSIRRYDDACGTAHGLELIGEKWALLIVRELMLGGHRFSQLRTDLPGVSANILTQRLTELEERGLVIRKRLPAPASTQIYELTPWGYEAEPIVQTMGYWAAKSPFHDPTLRISGVSMLLSLRTMFDRELAKGMKAEIGFQFGDEIYRATLNSKGLRIARGNSEGTDFTFSGKPEGLAAAVHGGASFDILEKANLLVVQGDRKLAKAFVKLFPLPAKYSHPQPIQTPGKPNSRQA